MTVSNNKPIQPAAAKPSQAFHWSYIALPLLVLVISLALTAIFFPRLPSQVAYHFAGDGAPDRWTGRGQLVTIMLVPQFVFTLFAAATTWILSKVVSRFGGQAMPVLSTPKGSTGNAAMAKPERIIRLMGNMIVLPQTVLAFAMLSLYFFNAFQIRLMPIWVFAVLVMVLGGVVLGILFARTIRGALRPTQ